MGRTAAALFILALAPLGCAGPPDNSILEPGTRAVVASDGAVGLKDMPDRRFTTVQPGEAAGESGSISRLNLRPVDR